MKTLPKIILLSLAGVLFLSASIKADTTAFSKKAELNHAEEGQVCSVYSADIPELIYGLRPGQNGSGVAESPPTLYAKTNAQDYSGAGFSVELAIQNSISGYLFFSKKLDISHSIRAIIYPFHFFW